MKHLKIYFAVLFFSFLGGINAELMAQSNTCKFGQPLTVLRSSNGKYELSVSLGVEINGYKKWPAYNHKFILGKLGGSIIWEWNIGCAEGNSVTIGKGRIMATSNEGNCVLFGGDNGQGTGTFLRLEDNGELALYGGSWIGDGDKVWSTGTCGGVLGGCGAVGAR